MTGNGPREFFRETSPRMTQRKVVERATQQPAPLVILTRERRLESEVERLRAKLTTANAHIKRLQKEQGKLQRARFAFQLLGDALDR